MRSDADYWQGGLLRLAELARRLQAGDLARRRRAGCPDRPAGDGLARRGGRPGRGGRGEPDAGTGNLAEQDPGPASRPARGGLCPAVFQPIIGLHAAAVRVPAAGGQRGGAAEFGMWLDRERGLSPMSVRCYCKQTKYVLASVGCQEAVSGLDAGKVTAFMVDWSRGSRHRVCEGDGDVAAGVPAVRARDRTDGCPAGRGGPGGRVVAAGRASPGLPINCWPAGNGVGLQDRAVLSLLARLELRGAEAADLQRTTSTGGSARSRSPARAARLRGSRCRRSCARPQGHGSMKACLRLLCVMHRTLMS